MNFGMIVIVVVVVWLVCIAYYRFKKPSFPSKKIAAEYGFTVMEDVAPSKFEVKDLELVSFLEDGESYVPGEVMRTRAVTLKANLGLSDAKYTYDHQAEIPPEFRKYYLVFTSTLLRRPGRRPGRCPHVAILYWIGGRWALACDWVGLNWYARGRLVRCKPARTTDVIQSGG